MADHFICTVCGKEHEGLPTDWAFTLPDDVWAVPEVKRGEVARFDSDLCQFGERFFLRGLLQLPFDDGDGFFGLGAWAEVDRSVFDRYLELYDKDGRSEPAHAGTLANALSPYSQTIGAPVLIQFDEKTRRPSLHLLPNDSSMLATEQRQGISRHRHHELLEQLTADR